MATIGHFHFRTLEYYSKLATMQRRVGYELISHLDGLIDDIEFNGDRPFVVCEYDAACGASAEPFIRHLMEKIKPRFSGPAKFQLIFEDLPSNDFRPIFRHFQDDVKSGNPDCQIFISAIGVSHLYQVLPNDSVDFGISMFGCHWISKIPCPLSNCIFYCLPGQKREEVAEWEKQHSLEWEAVLLARSAEMKKNGYLVVLFGK